MPLPSTVFGAATSVLTSLTAIDTALHFKQQPTSIIAKSGKLGAYGLAIGSAGYAGAIIGSAVMAANRATRCDVGQLKQAAKDLGLYGDWIEDAVKHFPEILSK